MSAFTTKKFYFYLDKLSKLLSKKYEVEILEIRHYNAVPDISDDKEGYVVYIWNPALFEKYRNRKDLKWNPE